MMLNVYSCGCTALDVSVVSQCEEHGGYVVAATEDVVPQSNRKAFMTKDKSAILFYTNLLEGMRKLSAGSTGLIFSYPDHFHFYTREFVATEAFRDFPDRYFPECRRILRKDGHIALIVEHTILSSVVYCARLSGFKLDDYFLVPMYISDLSLKHSFVDKYATYKAALVFSRNGESSNKKCANLKGFERHALSLHHKGLILDTSCIHYPFLVKSSKKSKSVGIVSNYKRYTALKQKLVKALM